MQASDEGRLAPAHAQTARRALVLKLCYCVLGEVLLQLVVAIAIVVVAQLDGLRRRAAALAVRIARGARGRLGPLGSRRLHEGATILHLAAITLISRIAITRITLISRIVGRLQRISES